MLDNFYTYISNYWTLYKYNIKKPSFCVPRSFIRALEELKNDTTLTQASYKLYPDDKSYTNVKIVIDKVKLKNRIKYIFSAWVGEKEYLKYREDDYDYLLNTIFEEVKNIPSKKIDKRIQKVKENFKQYSEEEQEYYLDYIYKNYPDKLFSWRKVIFTTQTNTYIKKYYIYLLRYFFQLSNYDSLVSYVEEIKDDKQTVEILSLKQSILKLIQEKNLLDIRLSELTNNYNIS